MCDDLFDSDTEDKTEDRLWQKTRNELTKEGFREGLDVGQEDNLQLGFNQGFSDSSEQLFSIAELRGHISALISFGLLQKVQLDEDKEKHLQDLLGDISVLEKQQHTLCDEQGFVRTQLKNQVKSHCSGETTTAERTAHANTDSLPCSDDFKLQLQQLKQRLKEILQ